MIYSGVGARVTPDWCLRVMEQTAFDLAEEGHVLRSGGAVGADTAFETGCDSCPSGRKEIYTGWNSATLKRLRKGIAAHEDIIGYTDRDLEIITPIIKGLGKDISKYSFAPKALQCRNVRIVLGLEGERPSDVVIAWTLAGEPIGGTATAIRLAEQFGIPVVNLGITRCGADELTEHIMSFGENDG